MKIQHKIILITCAIFGFVFAFTSFITYKSFIKSSESIFYKDLSRTAQISAMFYLEKDELNRANFLPIQNAFYQLNPDRKISIYDQSKTTAFNTESQLEINPEVLETIKEKSAHQFSINDTYYYGLFYEDNQGDFVVIVSAKNALIEQQKTSLLIILITVFCVGMLIITLLIWQMAKYAYKPVRNIIHQVDTLDLNSTELLLSYPKTNDELENLFAAFNNLLKEIKNSYQQQKNFVDHASHELKTPLASIINALEVTLQRPRTNEEYKENSENVLQSALRLERILKNLLLLSGIQRNLKDKHDVRIDETIWEIIEALLPKHQDRFQVEINILPQKMQILSAIANETLLYMAMFNLIENAAKFSKDQVLIKLYEIDNKLKIDIKDQGIGISPDEIQFLRQPFYRGKNTEKIDGNGLGFSIAYLILEAHHISINIKSAPEQGTTISLSFP
ncbi:HAMP domain-containing histidine kinase [Fulvivirga maritima]|uniref:HAMP domain-containing sensor histidine kinase n=1 Tax=Fulvivirga maritima TaxID=2904247 RepID=UPI001F339910|nr:HAMP domain-containing sensor histidine kinase [Fulvivirga maritima]UII25539.1 HAMP domain-containing histidine kinase [Fulvivirga maritima]